MENVISLEQLRAMPEHDYMNDTQLSFFEHLLNDLRQSTLDEIDESKPDITHANREPDPLDIAAIEDERTRHLRFVDRKIKFIRKIDKSLERIRKKDYGFCDETGNEIGIERLLIRPTANLSVDAKQKQEELEVHFSDER